MARIPAPRRPQRPAASVNADIRALWSRAQGRLSAEQRKAYENLVVEWAAAIRTEQGRQAA
ncbi:hypothetical protein [Streptomyces sp. NPDC002851]